MTQPQLLMDTELYDIIADRIRTFGVLAVANYLKAPPSEVSDFLRAGPGKTSVGDLVRFGRVVGVEIFAAVESAAGDHDRR